EVLARTQRTPDRAVVLRQPDVLAHARHRARGQALGQATRVNTTAEPLGTLAQALDHATRLLSRDPAAAAEQAAEILKVMPDQPVALTIAGLALGRLGQGDDAILKLRRAVALKADQPEAWRALGDHYTVLEMRDAADEAYA